MSGLQLLNLLAAGLQFLRPGLRLCFPYGLRGSKSFQLPASGFQFACKFIASLLLFAQRHLQLEQLCRIVRGLHFLLQRGLHRLDFCEGVLELRSPFDVFGHLLLDCFAPFGFLLQRFLELDQLVRDEITALQQCPPSSREIRFSWLLAFLLLRFFQQLSKPLL